MAYVLQRSVSSRLILRRFRPEPRTRRHAAHRRPHERQDVVDVGRADLGLHLRDGGAACWYARGRGRGTPRRARGCGRRRSRPTPSGSRGSCSPRSRRTIGLSCRWVTRWCPSRSSRSGRAADCRCGSRGSDETAGPAARMRRPLRRWERRARQAVGGVHHLHAGFAVTVEGGDAALARAEAHVVAGGVGEPEAHVVEVGADGLAVREV